MPCMNEKVVYQNVKFKRRDGIYIIADDRSIRSALILEPMKHVFAVKELVARTERL